MQQKFEFIENVLAKGCTTPCIRGTNYRAVYLARGLHTAEEMEGKDVHHICMHNWCVNPTHLTLLSTEDHFDGVHEGRYRIDHTGRKRSAESKRKMSEAQTGKTHSEETRRKMSEAHKGRTPWNKGKTRSAETKRKMSEAKKGEKNPSFGKKVSEKTRQKMSEAHKGRTPWNKGKTHSAETKRKMSEAMKGRTKSEETRRKLSIAAKKQWQRERLKKDALKIMTEGDYAKVA